ncbi:hypothetical protein ACTQ2W_04235, partial [Ligilactobacillus ruminis]|uniref:hypothetical protein n=1 Tax=Ligilactobacillus ruminis TaxID=1623 RepID=UPI003F9C19AD
PLTAPSRVIVDRHGCIRIPCTTCAWEKYFTHKLGLDLQCRQNQIELKEKTEIIFNGFGIFSAKKC